MAESYNEALIVDLTKELTARWRKELINSLELGKLAGLGRGDCLALMGAAGGRMHALLCTVGAAICEIPVATAAEQYVATLRLAVEQNDQLETFAREIAAKLREAGGGQ